MKTIFSSRKQRYVAKACIFLIVVALVAAGMVSCTPPTRYNLTMAVNPAGGGTAIDVTGAGAYASGTNVNIQATPAASYTFVKWTAPAGTFADPNAATTTFTMPALNVTATANFVGPLDHFKSYWVDLTTAPNITEVVYLEDQFCAVEATLGHAVAFGNPAEKVHGAVTTPISNPDHHLTAYEIDYAEEPRTWLVEVENQFGTQNLTVSGPYWLGVPTQKEGRQSPVGLDHYMIYQVVDGPSVDVSVSLQDEFDAGPQESGVYMPIHFASPVRKTHGSEVTEILDPETHFVSYWIDRGDFQKQVQVNNQFGDQTLDVHDPELLGVPSMKLFADPID